MDAKYLMNTISPESTKAQQTTSEQTVTITADGCEPANCATLEKHSVQRIGAMKGKLFIPDGFDHPLPGDMLSTFEGMQYIAGRYLASD